MSAKVQVACPKCRQSYSVAESASGQTLRCAKCGTSFRLSAGSGAASGPPAAGRSTVGGTASAQRSTSSGGGAASPAPPKADAGDLPSTVGPYQIRRRLGHGAMGDVYLAYHSFLDIEVAVKMLRASTRSSAHAVERFRREGKILARMEHPNVQRVYDAGTHGDDFYLVSAYIPGHDLADVIPADGLEPRRAVALAVQMLRALGHAHGLGIIHRDLKPANMRLRDQDTLVLMDFGMGNAGAPETSAEPGQDPMRLTQAGAIIGTPAYMAPEQASGQADQAGPGADLYSAGVVLYELLTGQLPFEAPNLPALLYAVVHVEPAPPSSLRSGLDPALDAICLRALAKHTDERFRSAAEFASELEGWMAGQSATPGLAPPPPLPRTSAERPAATRTREKGAAATGVGVTLASADWDSETPVAVVPARRRSRRFWVLAVAIPVLVVLLLSTAIGVYLATKKGPSGAEPARRGFFEDRDNYKH